MNDSRKLPYCVLLLFVFFVTSCKDKDPKIDCGCDGSTVKEIKNVKASYVGSNNLLLQVENPDSLGHEQLYQLCSKIDTLNVTPDIKNPDYIVSGNIKKNCFYGPTLVIQMPILQVTSIKRAL